MTNRWGLSIRPAHVFDAYWVLSQLPCVAPCSIVNERKWPLRIIVPTKLIIRQSSDPSTLGSAQETEIDVRSSPGPGSGKKKNVAMKIARTPPRRVAAIADG